MVTSVYGVTIALRWAWDGCDAIMGLLNMTDVAGSDYIAEALGVIVLGEVVGYTAKRRGRRSLARVEWGI